MSLRRFVEESNMIEGIFTTTDEQVEAHRIFLNKDSISTNDLISLVSILQPNALFREYEGLNVYVGNHVAPLGGVEIKTRLMDILYDINSKFISPYLVHCRYEDLHPFTDGNGRSGRALWYWYMKQLGKQNYVEQLGFLHNFYYQTLEQFHK